MRGRFGQTSTSSTTGSKKASSRPSGRSKSPNASNPSHGSSVRFSQTVVDKSRRSESPLHRAPVGQPSPLRPSGLRDIDRVRSVLEQLDVKGKETVSKRKFEMALKLLGVDVRRDEVLSDIVSACCEGDQVVYTRFLSLIKATYGRDQFAGSHLSSGPNGTPPSPKLNPSRISPLNSQTTLSEMSDSSFTDATNYEIDRLKRDRQLLEGELSRQTDFLELMEVWTSQLMRIHNNLEDSSVTNELELGDTPQPANTLRIALAKSNRAIDQALDNVEALDPPTDRSTTVSESSPQMSIWSFSKELVAENARLRKLLNNYTALLVDHPLRTLSTIEIFDQREGNSIRQTHDVQEDAL